MGPMGQIMNMMPGMNQMMGQMMGAGGERAMQDKIRNCTVIMDSMTNDELDGLVELSDSRL